MTRRGFLVAMQLAVGGLTLGVAWADEPKGEGLAAHPLVHVAVDGTVTITCHRSEMGQGIRSSIPVLIADELGADVDRIVVVQADGDKKYGDQNTDGSTSIRKFFEDLRKAGATARTMLVAAAAARWGVPADGLTAANGVVSGGGKSAPFAELVADAAKLPVPKPEDVRLRPRSELVHLGTDLPLLDGPAYVTGTAKFAADVLIPGLLIAVIARPPVVGGRVRRLDASAALAIPGVRKVFEMPQPGRPWGFQAWGGVAVVAENTWAAIRGREALKITWDHGSNGDHDSDVYRQGLSESASKPGNVVRELGDVDAALASASKTIEAEYHVPHLAQLPMEPPCATARIADGKCEIWACSQDPQKARANAAELAHVSVDDVTLHVTFIGGGFGRKSKADFIAEAVICAREVGAPVRVQWTREDDIRHGYYNTVSTQRLRAGLDATGKVVAWHHRTAFPPIASTFAPFQTAGPSDLQQGVTDLALAVPNVRAEGCNARSHVRVGWYRSVYNIFHGFAIGSFVDEIAHAAGRDPRDAWLDVIGPARKLTLAELGIPKLPNYGQEYEEHPVDAGRLRTVIERVTRNAGWDARAGRAMGLAAHRSFLAYVACVVSVVRDERRKIRVDEAWITIDAGTIVNRDRVHAQMQGAVVMGISNALFGGITMKRGATVQSNFHDARIARIGDVPRRIHVDIVDSEGPPCGVGEPGVPPVGPAIANAIFVLTGERIREMPFLPKLRS